MIVTTGRHIRIEAVSSSIILERTAETPGAVTVTRRKDGESIWLPANKSDSEEFIAAYRRAISEDIEYREQECEFAEKCPRCGSVDCAKDDIDVEPML
jgi:hypothetical protein